MRVSYWTLFVFYSFQTIDFENDWKIITVFIGGNDLCASCNDLVSPQPLALGKDFCSWPLPPGTT